MNNPAPPLTNPLHWALWTFTQSWNGRMGRTGYIIRRLVIYFAVFLLVWILLFSGFLGSVGFAIVLIAGLPIYITIMFRSVTLDIQRLHDINLPGWWLLLPLVLGFVPNPGTHFAAFIIYWVTALFMPGTEGANRYGAPHHQTCRRQRQPAPKAGPQPVTPAQPAPVKAETPQPKAEESPKPKPGAKPAAKKAPPKKAATASKKPVAKKANAEQKPSGKPAQKNTRTSSSKKR